MILLSKIIKSSRIIQMNDSKEVKNHSYEENIITNKAILEQSEIEYKKIIKQAKDLSLEIIEKAENQQETILNDAYNKARNILEKSKNDGYNDGYNKGYKEGYEKGYSEGKIVSDNLIKEALDIKNGYIYKKSKLLKDLEEDIIQLVITIYEKIINKKNEEDNDIIVSLVLNGINNLDMTDKLTIIASREDYDILELSKNEILAKASMISELEIKYDTSFEKGDCILETSKGNIDVSLKNQLEEVKELLYTILNNE